ncbi:8766_t:CDS:1, partial [Ambispora gerdemannii]
KTTLKFCNNIPSPLGSISNLLVSHPQDASSDSYTKVVLMTMYEPIPAIMQSQLTFWPSSSQLIQVQTQ